MATKTSTVPEEASVEAGKPSGPIQPETGTPDGDERFPPTVRPGSKVDLPNGLRLETF